MTYENVVCPVCSKKFTKDDDVVVCPECGTPMHRECYKSLGHCVNEEKHAEGFAWEAPYDAQAEQKRREEAERAAAAAAAGAASGNGQNGPEDDNPFGSYGQYAAGQEGKFGPNMRVISPNEKIGNYTAAEYSTVIGKNAHKYIPKFFVMQKTGRKMSWNFAAFFFPYFWFSYRKMYKEAFLAFLLSMILPLCFMNSIYKYYMTTIQATTDYLMSEPAASVENEQANEESNASQPAVLTVNSWVELAVQLFVGFYGNYMYRKKCDKVLSEGASRAGPDKAIFLAKKGGTSAWSVVAAILIMYAVFMAAVGIVMKYDTDLATIIWRLFNR